MSPADNANPVPHTCVHCGYIIDFLESDRCPECGTQLDASPRRAAPAFVLLLGLTIANASIAAFSAAIHPRRGATPDSPETAWDTVWDGAGVMSGLMITGWLVLFALDWRARRERTPRWGMIIAALHLLLYACLP